MNLPPPSSRRDRKAAGTRPPPTVPHVLILASEDHTAKLCELISFECKRVKNKEELVALAKRHNPVAACIDIELCSALAGELPNIPIVGIIDALPGETLPKAVQALCAHPSIAHVIAAPLLTSTLARAQLKNLFGRLTGGLEHDLLGTASVGRVAMLRQASRRGARFERMQQYFSKHGMSPRVISLVHEVAEELVMNAIYNAPTEAGYFKGPVSRMDDVTLPPDRACEVSYGIEDGTAFVRVRDSFGALRRSRLLEVLKRCASNNVTLDESRGGAGLGIWRVFSSATTIAITVIPGRLTDILIRMAPKQGKAARQVLAIDLFFLPDSSAVPEKLTLDHDIDLLDRSVTVVKN